MRQLFWGILAVINAIAAADAVTTDAAVWVAVLCTFGFIASVICLFSNAPHVFEKEFWSL